MKPRWLIGIVVFLGLLGSVYTWYRGATSSTQWDKWSKEFNCELLADLGKPAVLELQPGNYTPPVTKLYKCTSPVSKQMFGVGTN